jgi:hypothetical protein
MIDRLILGVVLSVVGCNGFLPDKPPTQLTLKEKAKMKSVGKVCVKKNKQTPTVKQLCKRWEVQKSK